jgi:rhodanese-related sulfurtransferase
MSEPGELRRINAAEAWRLVTEGRAPVFLDTRNPYHRAKSGWQIPGSLRIWRGELEARINDVPRGRPIVIYCACHYEHSSTRAALTLEEYDYDNLYILVGGIKSWQDAGLLLEMKSEEDDSVRHLAIGPLG